MSTASAASQPTALLLAKRCSARACCIQLAIGSSAHHAQAELFHVEALHIACCKLHSVASLSPLLTTLALYCALICAVRVQVWVPDKTIAWAKGTVRKAYADGKTFDVQLDSDSGEVSSDGAGASAKGTVTVNITQPEYIAIGCDGLPLQNKVCSVYIHTCACLYANVASGSYCSGSY